MKIWFWRVLAWGGLAGYIVLLLLAPSVTAGGAWAAVGVTVAVVTVAAFCILLYLKRKAKIMERVALGRERDFYFDEARRQFDAGTFLHSVHAKFISSHISSGAFRQRYSFSVNCLVGDVLLELETLILEMRAGEGLTGISFCSTYGAEDSGHKKPLFTFSDELAGKKLVWCNIDDRQVVAPESVFKVWREKAEEYGAS